MIKLIQDQLPWQEVLKGSNLFDSYHTFQYHQISKSETDEAILFAYEDTDCAIAIPLIIREIGGTLYKDATSAYGYIGPIYHGNLNSKSIAQFQNKLQDALRKLDVITVFARLNPFIPKQEKILSNLGELSIIGSVINIDLTNEIDKQFKLYQSRLRTYVNKARKECIVRQANSLEDIDIFLELYYQTMKRVGAQSAYYFDRKYFDEIGHADDFDCEILMAEKKTDKKVIGSALFLKKNDIVHYHLSGSDEGYLKLNPIKLLIDEMRIRATQEGYKYLNLGGGVGNRKDSLFQFKTKFSPFQLDFILWKWIIDPEVYKSLLDKLYTKNDERSFKECEDYFPLYRCSYLEL